MANHTGLPTASTRWSHLYRAGCLRAVEHATSALDGNKATSLLVDDNRLTVTVVHRYRRLATLQPVATATKVCNATQHWRLAVPFFSTCDGRSGPLHTFKPRTTLKMWVLPHNSAPVFGNFLVVQFRPKVLCR